MSRSRVPKCDQISWKLEKIWKKHRKNIFEKNIFEKNTKKYWIFLWIINEYMDFMKFWKIVFECFESFTEVELVGYDKYISIQYSVNDN